MMNLSKSFKKGESNIYFDSIKGVLFGVEGHQGMSFIATLLFMSNGTNTHQCGSEKAHSSSPKALQAYNLISAIWILCILIKPLEVYSQTIGKAKIGMIKDILRYLLVNGNVAWNMWDDITGIIREKINNSNWGVYIFELMLNLVNPTAKCLEVIVIFILS